MRKRIVLLLAVMLAALVVASGAALAADTLDQENTDLTATGTASISDGSAWAQSFTPTIAGNLDKVSVYIDNQNYSAPSGSVVVWLQSTRDGGTADASYEGAASGSIPLKNIPHGSGWVDIPLQHPGPLEPGHVYRLAMETGPTGYNWRYSTNDPYPGGRGSTIDNSSNAQITAQDDFLFKTYVAADHIHPYVLQVSPLAGSTGVSRASVLSAYFSEAMKPSTISTSTFTLTNTATGERMPATVECVNDHNLDQPLCTSAKLTPSQTLAANTKYKAQVTTGAQDEVGNALDQSKKKKGKQPKTWYFTTGSS